MGRLCELRHNLFRGIVRRAALFLTRWTVSALLTPVSNQFASRDMLELLAELLARWALLIVGHAARLRRLANL